jgi:prephenate dehydrogenase
MMMRGIEAIGKNTIGIVGLGLMGGAIARSLRGIAGRIVACDIDSAVLAAALCDKVIDEGTPSPEQMLPHCDMVFLCLNPTTLLEFMERWMGAFASGALLTDIAGVKGPIVAAMEETLRADLDFIPGHPMAGSEKGGYFQAEQCRFAGKNYLLTPLKRNKPENLAFIRALISRMGFGRITETTAAEHDRNIAFTSQLCHLIAAALVDAESDTAITRFGGGSFEDLTRIAMLNAPQWTELFLENRASLLPRISQFEASLNKLKTCIESGQKDALQKTLQRVRERRSAMSADDQRSTTQA